MPRLKGDKKALTETQTLRASCSKAEPKKFISPHRRPPSRGGGGTARIQSAGDGHYLYLQTQFGDLVRIDARNFELSW